MEHDNDKLIAFLEKKLKNEKLSEQERAEIKRHIEFLKKRETKKSIVPILAISKLAKWLYDFFTDDS